MTICCAFVASYAQDCDMTLQTARDFRGKNDYGNAVVWYQKVLDECGDYDGRVEAELSECQYVISLQRTVEHYVGVTDRELYVNDTLVLFAAAGGTDSHIEVTSADGWFVTTNSNWLEASNYGNHLVVNCHPNKNPMSRSGQLYVVGGKGTSTVGVTVRQLAEKTQSSPVPRPVVDHSRVDHSRPVKISFEGGKATPVFENVWSLIKMLEENNNLSLHVEVPWCRNQYTMQLIEKRIKNITDYFVASGIDKDRISKNITLIDVEDGGPESDCAYPRTVKQTADVRIEPEGNQEKSGEENGTTNE